MSWISLGLKFIMWIAGLCGFGTKDERDVERKAGEDTGVKEAQNAGLQKYVDEEQSIKDRRDSVNTDPASVWDDPNNLANPANKPKP